MRVDHPRRGVEAGVGDPHHADLAVVVGDAFHQPVDRVKGICAFVDVGRTILRWLLGAYVDELAFGAIAAADVLEDEYEILPSVVLQEAAWVGVAIYTIGLEPVRCASQKDGARTRVIFGRIDGSEELYAIAHRDLILVLCVKFAEAGLTRRSGDRRSGGRGRARS